MEKCFWVLIMKKLLVSSFIGLSLIISACSEKKDYEYYKTHIDEAKTKVRVCHQSTKDMSNDDECLDAEKAFREYRKEQSDNATKVPKWKNVN